jgi:two-component system, chemotaxis family, sensor kinase Cph1
VAYVNCSQPHGIILVFDLDTKRLVQRSENWSKVWSEDILGKPLDELLPSEAQDLVESCSERRRVYLSSPPSPYELAIHRTPSHLLVEIALESTDASSDEMVLIQAALARFESARTVRAFVQILADEMRNFLDVRRAMVYQFLPDWTGEIVAECCTSGVEQQYVDLRFPATDIPAPARDVFRKNWTREIRDVEARPVELTPNDPNLSNRTDLSRSLYRAASPIHIEYLKNMGVRSTLTGTIRVGDSLWGLLACHHDRPLEIGIKKRSSIELLLELASLRLSQMLSEKSSAHRGQVRSAVSEFEEGLKQLNFLRLDQNLETLGSLVESDSVAVFQSNHWKTNGTLKPESLFRMKDYVQELSSDQVVSTTSCPAEVSGPYPGVLQLRSGDDYAIFWLRRIEEYTIRWAGDPRKAELSGPVEDRLSPRSSFQQYVEKVENQSAPWSEHDFWALEELAGAVQRAALFIAERSELQKQALQRSNEELEAFAFMASHDLQEPIRGIYNYTEALLEEHSDTLGKGGSSLAQGVLSLADRMNLLIRDLLHYARLGERDTTMTLVNTERLVQNIVDFAFAAHREEIVADGDLPEVYGYDTFIGEVFTNLISNAVKYTGEDKVIRIGTRESRDPSKHVLYVKDNGIGIHPDHHGRIFNLFRRLHPPDSFGGGSGAGLTIVKRMLERHGCAIWVESNLEQGTTFLFELPKG